MFIKPELLAKHHDANKFDCGNKDLNDFLKKYARQNIKKDASKTFVTCLIETNTVVGYYTLVTGSVNHKEAPEKIKKGMSKHPIPIILIAKLATDNNYQGKGLGKNLLKDALFRTVQVSNHIGVRAIHVNAKDESAAIFYKKYDFIESPIDEFSLFILMKDIKALFEN